MLKDRRKEIRTGFVPTSHDIGLAVEASPTASVIRSRSTTVARIHKWVEQKQLLNVRFPDAGMLVCIFTGNPIGEDDPFIFLRFRSGDKKKARIVMCLASCKPDESRYEVIPIENGGVGTFKVAVGNMTNVDSPIDRSLYY